MIHFFQKILRPIFGSFETEEFKKFIRLGLTFTLIIGAYWTLRVLKNSIFCNLVGSAEIPYAKTFSLIVLFFLLMVYSKLLDKFDRQKSFYLLSSAYGVGTLIFSVIIPFLPSVKCAPEVNATLLTRIIAYAGYIFVESYGSLLVALFWAIASDTTKPSSAKQGFYFIVAIGQLGGILGPYFIPKLPKLAGFTTNGFPVAACSLLIFLSIPMLRRFFTKTPHDLLVSYHGIDEDIKEKEIKPGFLEGLKLLLSKPYLLGIFGSLFFFEFITTIFDLHFNTLASATYSGTQLSEYLGIYGSSVNFTALACLLLGISNIPKYLGLTASLCLLPIIMTFFLFGFYTMDSLTFLFLIMVGSKALHYAFNNPAIKQLYIPTTQDVRFKAQAWIEIFGSRGSKQTSSLFNMMLKPLQQKLGPLPGRVAHAIYGTYAGLSIVIIWLFVALYLGTKYRKAIKENRMVC